jgi:hypothetical protein
MYENKKTLLNVVSQRIAGGGTEGEAISAGKRFLAEQRQKQEARDFYIWQLRVLARMGFNVGRVDTRRDFLVVGYDWIYTS